MSAQFTVSIPKLPAKDLEATKKFYVEKLGFSHGESFPDYLILKRDGAEVHFFQHRQLDINLNNAMCYVRVSRIEELHAELKAKDVLSLTRLETKPWRQKEFSVNDNQNNQITFGEKA